MVGSAARALLDYSSARASCQHLLFPIDIIVRLEIVKLLGVAAVLSNVLPFLKNQAYAGFFYHLLLAPSAHVAAGDGPEMRSSAIAVRKLQPWWQESRNSASGKPGTVHGDHWEVIDRYRARVRSGVHPSLHRHAARGKSRRVPVRQGRGK